MCIRDRPKADQDLFRATAKESVAFQRQKWDEQEAKALEILIHLLVALFGGIMVQSGMLWTRMKWDELDPMLQLPVGIDYLSLVIAGVLIVMFSFEHIVALLRGEDVVPSWY